MAGAIVLLVGQRPAVAGWLAGCLVAGLASHRTHRAPHSAAASNYWRGGTTRNGTTIHTPLSSGTGAVK
jgi:hypothetical protein